MQIQPPMAPERPGHWTWTWIRNSTHTNRPRVLGGSGQLAQAAVGGSQRTRLHTGAPLGADDERPGRAVLNARVTGVAFKNGT